VVLGFVKSASLVKCLIKDHAQHFRPFFDLALARAKMAV
jgi:hypothetical protein